MPVSSSSMKIRYSLILSLTDQDARIAIGMRNVVSNTRKMLMPSIPTIYSMPKAGIQGMRSIICISPLVPSNPFETPSDQKKLSVLAISAMANSA